MILIAWLLAKGPIRSANWAHSRSFLFLFLPRCFCVHHFVCGPVVELRFMAIDNSLTISYFGCHFGESRAVDKYWPLGTGNFHTVKKRAPYRCISPGTTIFSAATLIVCVVSTFLIHYRFDMCKLLIWSKVV